MYHARGESLNHDGFGCCVWKMVDDGGKLGRRIWQGNEYGLSRSIRSTFSMTKQIRHGYSEAAVTVADVDALHMHRVR